MLLLPFLPVLMNVALALVSLPASGRVLEISFEAPLLIWASRNYAKFFPEEKPIKHERDH